MTFRDNGAIGALLDEYERAVKELQQVIRPISQEDLLTIVDPDTKDADCRSIQTILSHVVYAGYGYIVYLRKSLGEEVSFKEKLLLNSIEEYQLALEEMFHYNEQFFEDHPNFKLEEYDIDRKILTRWGQRYDGDQIIEHAIVHILRHRRQIERFLLKLENKKG